MSVFSAFARRPWLLPVLFGAGLALYPVIRPYDIYPQTVLLLAFLLAIQAVGWNIISGYAGYVSLGHSVFVGLGSYTAGVLSVRIGLNPLLAAPLGGIVAVVAAVLAGAVVLRTRGHAFVIITIALLLATQVIAVNWDALTNGSDGITLPLPPWSRDIQNVPFYVAFLVLMLAGVAFSAWIRRTRFGTGLVAIREDEGKAASIGVDTTRFKITAYAASAFFPGMAGAVYAYFLTFLNPVGAFNVLGSVMIVLAALVGGRGTLWGPVIGAFVVSISAELATVYGGGAQSRVLLFGGALVVVVLFLPAGLLPVVQAWWRRRHPVAIEYTDQGGALSAGRYELRPRVEPVPVEPGPVQHDVPLLEVRGVTKRFGGLVAVDNADLTVPRGSITALIGPNGSGKTTLFNLVTGTMRADAGEVRFDGTRIDRLPPWQRGHLGLGRTFQLTRLFRSMTVLENMVAPMPDGRWRTMVADARDGREAERARELLAFVGMARFADTPAGALSYGQQKLVELAQVLMTEPKLVLLDEPAGGVNPSLVARLSQIVRDLNAQGVGFLVVEHNIPMVLELCDPVVVFSRGSVIAHGPPDIVRNDPVVLDAYLGEDWSDGASPAVAEVLK
ncbi:branched-chain amino acid ABC transporter ATP-binding protein/permease [Pseudonocardia sp. TRM90224]|uniref:branched-chain amino acid ABC transporter ATP-binding protein/permease n=1 Tax=Pseudonocardia sp. TRM90224 TaxID=2812678 RepID=UPI001E5621E5|nr:branched-chain amino acid ABC transporter ATP-binding protein/permease [Pseudonocardia sp. TRM90224]